MSVSEQEGFRDYARRRLEENAPPPERLPIMPVEVMTQGQRFRLKTGVLLHGSGN